MSEKQLKKLSKDLEKAENSARLRQFGKASKQYEKLVNLAKQVDSDLLDQFIFLQHLYQVNHDISQRNDPLVTGTLYSFDSLSKDMADHTLTMALPGGLFGDYETKRVFDESRAIILMNRGMNENNPAMLFIAIVKFLAIGKEQLFFGRYVGAIKRHISGVRAALECEARSHVIRGAEISDMKPSRAIPHYMLATRAYRAARRDDLEDKYRGILIGLKKIGKCWFCGRLVQGANHFKIMKSVITPYFTNLLKENKEDQRVFDAGAVIACIPCAGAIEQEAHRIAGQYHEWTVKQLEIQKTEIHRLARTIDSLTRVKEDSY